MTIPFYLIILADNAQCNPFFKKKVFFRVQFIIKIRVHFPYPTEIKLTNLIIVM